MEELLTNLKRKLKKGLPKKKKVKNFMAIKRLPELKYKETEREKTIRAIHQKVQKETKIDKRTKKGKQEIARKTIQALGPEFTTEEIFTAIQQKPMDVEAETFIIKRPKPKLTIPSRRMPIGSPEIVKDLGFTKVVLEEPMNTNEL